MAAFEKENGEITDDPFEKSEILRKQYESVASVPMKEYEVKEDFFEDNTEENENVIPLIDICDTQPFVSALTCWLLEQRQVQMESLQQ